MSEQELQYKRRISHLGVAMIVFLGCFFVFSVMLAFLEPLSGWRGALGDILHEVLYGLGYAAVFTIPVVFYRLFFGKRSFEKPFFTPELPRSTVLYLFAGLAVILVAAYINNLLLEVFSYSEFMEELTEPSVMSNYQIVLAVFTTALIPAFFEELLFRGLVLTNLLPYGRTTAILGSALLFGLMHQNAGQLLYATVAGLVLGYLYVKTRSIFGCILLHFVNNFSSVLQSVLYLRLPAQTAGRVMTVIEIAILALGLLSLLLLILGQKDSEEQLRRDGAFLTGLAVGEDVAQIEIAPARRIRLFFALPMTIFVILCVLSMGGYILIALMGGLIL